MCRTCSLLEFLAASSFSCGIGVPSGTPRARCNPPLLRWVNARCNETFFMCAIIFLQYPRLLRRLFAFNTRLTRIRFCFARIRLAHRLFQMIVKSIHIRGSVLRVRHWRPVRHWLMLMIDHVSTIIRTMNMHVLDFTVTLRSFMRRRRSEEHTSEL